MTVTVGWGEYLQVDYAAKREKEVEFLFWWVGMSIWYANHGSQQAYQIFHTRDKYFGIPVLWRNIRS